MSWKNNELNEFVDVIIYELQRVQFEEVEDWDEFASYIKKNIKSSSDYDRLSEVIIRSWKEYQDFENQKALLSLVEKGLVKMYVNEDGELSYGATEDGMTVNKLLNNKNKNK